MNIQMFQECLETENRTYERRKKASERTSDDKSGESEEEEAFYSAGYDSI